MRDEAGIKALGDQKSRAASSLPSHLCRAPGKSEQQKSARFEIKNLL
jgi:hypothetical protein